MLEAALAYAKAGRPVFPLGSEGEARKRPLPGSRGLLEATTDEAQIRKWWEAHPKSNVGLATGKPSGLVVVDLDGDDAVTWFKTNVPESDRARIIQSTRAGRFHALYAQPPDVEVRNTTNLFAAHVDIRGTGGYIVVAPSVHPTGARYTWRVKTGAEWKVVDPTDPALWAPENLVPLPKVFIEAKPAQFTPQARSIVAEGLPKAGQGERNDTATRLVGRWLAKGLASHEVLELLRMWNATNCTPPLEDFELETIVRSITDTHLRNHPDAITPDAVNTMVRDWVERQRGVWDVRALDHDLGLRTAAEFAMRDQALAELRKSGVIDNAIGVAGRYRRKDTGLEYVKLCEEPPPELPLYLPLNLNTHVRIRPQNLIVVAGETNSGKSSILLDIAYGNRLKMPTRYLSSEMSPEELTERCAMLGPIDTWAPVELINRTRDFADAILPGGLNLIDFLEIPGGEFWQVADMIRAIFDALRGGIAVIAVQKKKDAEFGRGAEFSLEKARLALSLYHRGTTPDGIVVEAHVTKCKNYKPGLNIDGKSMVYEVVNGRLLTQDRLINAGAIGRDGWNWMTAAQKREQATHLDNYLSRANDRQPGDNTPLGPPEQPEESDF